MADERVTDRRFQAAVTSQLRIPSITGREAATEFRKIIDNRGHAPLSTLYPLAQLGLARASALAGDTAGARTAYQNFLALWKDADANIAVRQEAQHEYQKLE